MAVAETGGVTQLGDDLSVDGVDFAEGELRATVAEGDTRSLDTVGEAVESFEDYLVEKENQVLIMEEEESGDKLVLPHEHRWTVDYRRRTYARLKAVERRVRDVWGERVPTTMLTLTAPHKDGGGEYRPFVSVLEDLKDGWDKARRVIRRETEGVKTEFLAVYEPHDSGYPHLHVIIFGVARESLGEKVKEYWVDRYVDGASLDAQDVTVRRGRSLDLEHPAAYIMKYLAKTLIREGEGEATAIESLPSVRGYMEFSALLWATGSRMYSMSEGLSKAVKESAPESETVGGEWVFVGVASGIETGMYRGELGEELGKYLTGSVNQQRPPGKRRERNGSLGVG